MLTTPRREDWLISIRSDGTEPWMEVRSEYVARRSSDNHRFVVQGLPQLKATVRKLGGVSMTLPDGRTVTVMDVITALQQLACEAVDQVEADGRPEETSACLHDCITRKRAKTKESK